MSGKTKQIPNRNPNRCTMKEKPHTETITIYRNGLKGKTQLLTPLYPQMIFYAESVQSYEERSKGLTEAEAEAAALDRAVRYIINAAYNYLTALYKKDKRAAYDIVMDIAKSLEVSESGRQIKIRSI